MSQATCFAIMPFRDRFDDVAECIEHAATAAGLTYMRSDQRLTPGRIMPQVIADIEAAAVVVADISDHNPNVFYELALAHYIKGADCVVILAPADATSFPYDVHEFRQLSYKPSVAGLAELTAKLQASIRAAAENAQHRHRERWDVVRGRLPRTRLLVRELNAMTTAAGSRGLNGITIRVAAGLSSLAISNHEPADPTIDEEYVEALRAERDALRAALAAGVKLKAVLNPPRRFPAVMLPDRLRVRFTRLIGLLEGRSDIDDDPAAAAADLRAIERCQFTLSPVPVPNLMILGERAAFEGMKRGGTGGFEMTHWETDPHDVKTLVDQFDRFYDSSQSELLSRWTGKNTQEATLEELRQTFAEATRA